MEDTPDHANRKRAAEAGADCYLQKPVTKDSLEQQLIIATRIRARALEASHVYQITFDKANIGIAHVSAREHDRGRFRRVNAKLCEYLGYSKEQLSTMTFQNITHPDDLAESGANLRNMLSGAISELKTQKRYRTASNGYIWANLIVSLVRDEAGEPDFFVSVIEDITMQKESADRYRSLMESLPDAVVVHHDGIVKYVNRATVEMFGFALASDILGSNILDRFPPRHHGTLRDRFKTIREGGKLPTLQLTMIRQDGREFDIEGRVRSIMYAGQRCAQVVITDITGRKAAETRFDLVVRASATGIWDWDIRTGKEFWSDRFYEILGVEARRD